MSDILTPQGLEPNEALQDGDSMEVYQPTSGGIRRNKQGTLATLKAFFFKLTSFTPNSIVEADGTGNFRTTSITTSALSQSITDTNANTNNLTANVNQGVKTTDEPTFQDATIGGHAIDAELDTLNNRVNQGVKTTDTPEFADVNITGLTGTVEDRIETNTADIATNAGDIFTLDGRVDSNDTDISTLDGRVDGHDTDIGTLDARTDALETKTPQSYKTTDTITLVDLILTGLGNIKAIIQGLVDSVIPEDRYFDLIPLAGGSFNLTALEVKQTGIITVEGSSSSVAIKTPTVGVYSWSFIRIGATSGDDVKSVITSNPNTDIKPTGSTDSGIQIIYRRIS